MISLRARAPGKVNLCLFVGPVRADGRHELVSVVQSLSLADEVVLAARPEGATVDVIDCPAVAGPNLAGAALAAFRAATGWSAPAVELRIDKRVPVAGGMGGGSGDAAATLRLAAAASGMSDATRLVELAVALGADVPAQVSPGRALVQGAGEQVTPLGPAGPPAVLVVLDPRPLSTAAVFAEADRLGLPRAAEDLERRRAALCAALRDETSTDGPHGLGVPADLVVNDLEPATLSLRPELSGRLERIRRTGADAALVSGSGPTLVGLFGGPDGPERARKAALCLSGSPNEGEALVAIVATPVDASFAVPTPAR